MNILKDLWYWFVATKPYAIRHLTGGSNFAKAAPVVDNAPSQTPVSHSELKNKINIVDKSFIKSIYQKPLSGGEFLAETHKKTQIYLHHTAGSASARNTVNNWDVDSRGRIATCVAISNKGDKRSPDGEIVQAFSSKHWAYHLGVKGSFFKEMGIPYKALDKTSIGIELCAWGPLRLKEDGYYNYVNRLVPEDEVCELGELFRGYRYYHKYSDAQIESTYNLLKYWGDAYGIPLDYNEDIFDLNEDALKGVPGVYTHCSVRPDKTDVFPQPELIQMLKSL
tara:strand:+ start:3991 stop:4830 length:840 start_codon:yes stop_codon:yes gene_type:complete